MDVNANILEKYEQLNNFLSRKHKMNGIVTKLQLGAKMSIEDLRETLKKVFGEQVYDCLYDFFCGVLGSRYDYKLIQSGSTYTLFQIFTQIIFEELKIKNMDKTNSGLRDIYTVTYIYGVDKATLKHELEDKTVLIVDIALINGCELSKLVDYLTDNGVSKIATCTFIEKEQADAISPSLAQSKKYAEEATFLPEDDKIMYHSVVCNTLVCRTFINAIYEFIMQVNYACTSFTDSYTLANTISSDTISQAFGLSYSGTIQQTRIQRYVDSQQEVRAANIMLSCLSDTGCDSRELLSGTDFMVRKYLRKNRTENIIPFTLLPMMRADVLNNIYGSTENDSPIDADILKYRYQQLSYRLSDYVIRRNAEPGDETMSHRFYSFGISDYNDKPIIDSFILMQKKAAADENVYNLNAFEPWGDAARILKDVLMSTPIKNSDDICDALLIYMDKLYQYNEELVRCGRYPQNISIHNMLGLLYAVSEQKKLYLCSAEWSYILGFILNMCDSGIAKFGADVYFIGDSYWVDGCITNGEQAYCAAFEKKEYDEFLICAQILTQGTSDIYIGMERLDDMENKLSKERLIPDCVDFSKIKEFYIKNETLNPIAETTKSRHPYSYLLHVISR